MQQHMVASGLHALNLLTIYTHYLYTSYWLYLIQQHQIDYLLFNNREHFIRPLLEILGQINKLFSGTQSSLYWCNGWIDKQMSFFEFLSTVSFVPDSDHYLYRLIPSGIVPEWKKAIYYYWNLIVPISEDPQEQIKSLLLNYQWT